MAETFAFLRDFQQRDVATQAQSRQRMPRREVSGLHRSERHGTVHGGAAAAPGAAANTMDERVDADAHDRRPHQTDRQLQEHVQDALDWEPSVDAADIGVSADSESCGSADRGEPVRATQPGLHSTPRRRRRRSPETARSIARLTVNHALIALLIAAMDANQHVSADEAARAHNIIWSMKRFRRKSGESVGRLIGAMRTLIEAQGPVSVIAAAARSIPPRLRLPAFAVCADLILADGKLESAERRFLKRLGRDLAVDDNTLDAILAVMSIKNSA